MSFNRSNRLFSPESEAVAASSLPIRSNPNLLNLLQGEHIGGPVVELGGARGGVGGDGLRLLDRSPILQVRRNSCSPEGVTAGRLGQPDGFSTELHHPQDIGLI